MQTAINTPSFKEWHEDMMDCKAHLWRHLNDMELGVEGSFSQKIFAAMCNADIKNKRKLYETFSVEFNPKA